MIGRGVVRSGGGELTGGVGSGDPGVAASTHVAGDVAAGMTGGAGGAVGSLRTEDGTSGRGASSAIRASISRRLRPLDRASTASWFSSVRCGRRIRTDVRDTAPEASRSRIIGKSRQASGLDTVAGGVLGEPEHLRAVGEERTVAFGGVEGGSGVEHGQVGDELDRGLPFVAREHTDAHEEIVIRETGG